LQTLAGLALDRLSCSRFLGNQFRLLLTAAAYILVQALRLHAAGTSCATAQATTLRERLLKVGCGSRSRSAASSCTEPVNKNETVGSRD
jgi:Transposase DDE domain group 1